MGPSSIEQPPRFGGLPALFVNCSLQRSPEPTHTDRLIERSAAIVRRDTGPPSTASVPAHGQPRTAWDQASKADADDPEHR